MSEKAKEQNHHYPPCVLCDKNPQQEKSHIIPKFIVKRIKAECEGAMLRNGENPNIPRQDGLKRPMFCPACEDMFSVWEKHFSETIYHPFYNRPTEMRQMRNDPKSLKFMASLAYRGMAILLQDDAFPDEIKNDYTSALCVLSDFLLEKRDSLAPLFFEVCVILDYDDDNLREQCSSLYYYIRTGMEFNWLTYGNIAKFFITNFGPFYIVLIMQDRIGLMQEAKPSAPDSFFLHTESYRHLPEYLQDYVLGGLEGVKRIYDGISPSQGENIKKRWNKNRLGRRE